MGIPELLFSVVGVLILLAALAWGQWRYQTRNRALDPVREQVTRDIYREEDRRRERIGEA